MRRKAALVLIAVLVLSACGGGGGEKAKAKSFALPEVSTAELGVEPTLRSITAPPPQTTTSVLTRGTGRALAADDLLVADVKGQVWDVDGVELPAFVNTFGKRPLIRRLDDVVPGWATALPGVPIGSRVLLAIPAADGFGAQGNTAVGVLPGDSLMFVIDVLDAFGAGAAAAGKASNADKAPSLPSADPTGADPKLTVPEVAAPQDLIARVLTTGGGPQVRRDSSIVAQYTGALWRNGKVFDSSWQPGRGPFGAVLGAGDPANGEGGVIEGWVKGLTGQTVGSRVILVIPPKLGYGAAGNEAAGIKGTDTLVFVIDLLGTY
ncbi:MAG: FKBP-type peptidyl-prolyl cis-trans isomerase [Sporichthyaceae bacterium]